MERAALPESSSSTQRCLELSIALVSVILTTSPLWASLLIPAYWTWAFFFFSIYWLYRAIRLAIQGALAFRALKVWDQCPWLKLGSRHPRWPDIQHLVVYPTYREPLAVIETSLRYLLAQDFPPDRTIVVVAFEGRDRDAPDKARILRERFGPAFGRFWTTIHPDRPGEVRGKSSNLAYAVSWAHQRLTGELGLRADDVIVSVCDADSRLHPKYLSALAYRYLTEPASRAGLFQPAMLFHANLERLPALFRALNGFYSMVLLAKLRRRHTLISQSTYSLSLATCAAIDYWDVDIIPEDSHMLFKTLFRSSRRVTVQPIYLPVWADAAEGADWWATLMAHYRQTRRWAWGVSDVPYILWHGVRASQVPLWLRALRIGHYLKEHLLWPSHWFILFGGLKLVPVTAPRYALTLQFEQLNAWSAAFLSLSFCCLLFVMLVDQEIRARYAPHSAPPEAWPYLFYWLAIPAIGLFVSVLPAAEAHLRLLLGRRLEYQVTEKLAAAPAGLGAPSALAAPSEVWHP